MQLMIHMPNKQKAGKLLKLLSNEGVSDVPIVSDTSDAVKLNHQKHIDCVLFDRSLTVNYDDYFQKYYDDEIYFVPVSDNQTIDYLDVIDAINSQRAAYYLSGEIDAEHIKTMLYCIRQRLITSMA